MVTLGRRIKDRRQELGLTVRGFAARLGVQPPFVTDIEADRRRPGQEVLTRVAAILAIPLEELQALDPRIPPEVKEWMEEEPRVSTLLRRMSEAADREALLGQVEQVVEREQHDKGEER